MVDLMSFVRRHRSYLAAAAAIATLLLVFPSAPDRTAAGLESGAGPAAPASGVLDPSAPTDPLAPGAGGGETGDGQTGTGAPGSTGGGPTAPGGVVAPGIGTAEALANPRCDAARKHIKVKYAWAPPCVLPWPAGSDNGGSTAQGVTGDKVKVVLRIAARGSEFAIDSPEVSLSRYDRTRQIFQDTYETWGREVVFEPFLATGNSEAAQRADALQIASRKPFAVISMPDVGPVFESEIAKAGIVSIGFNVTPDVGAAQAPYRWGATADQWGALVALGEFAGKGLAGRPAKWAGDPSFQQRPRKFGVVVHDVVRRDLLTKELVKYGVDPVVVAYSSAAGTFGDPARSQEQAPTLIAKMKDAGVTTVLAFTDYSMTAALFSQASSQGYRPEWVSADYQFSWLVGAAIGGYDPSQYSHAMAIDVGSPRPPLMTSEVLWNWYWGNTTDWDVQAGLLVSTFFTGIHLAGPVLTPASFQRGMFSMPNSGGVACNCTASAMFSFGRQGAVPWEDYTALDDFAVSWFDPKAVGKSFATGETTTGMPRYIHNAKRYRIGSFPTEEPPMFDPANTLVNFAEVPAGERIPDYPCEGCPGG